MSAGADPAPEHSRRARTRRARNSLSRQEILDAARELVESEGLERLSMPALARRLGCAAMSIYGYFANKSDLVDALAGQVMLDLHRRLPPAGDGPWEEELLAYFTAYRDLMADFTAYREVTLHAPISVLRAALTPAQLRRLDTGIGLLTRAGLPLEDAARTYNVCYSYTRSFVALERVVRAADEEGAGPRHAAPTHLEHAEYPRLAGLADVSTALALDAAGFDLGLRLLIAGIARTFGLPTGNA